MKETFISSLVADLQSVTPLRAERLWLIWALCLGVFVAGVLINGVRPDFQAALVSGSLFWKPGIFVLLGLSSLLLLNGLARPVSCVRGVFYAPLALSFVIMGVVAAMQLRAAALPDVLSAAAHPDGAGCILAITAGGFIAWLALWRFWLKRSAPQRPGLAGLVTGLGAGCVFTAAYALHCEHDGVAYIAVYYGGGVLFSAALGLVLGRRLLTW